jgi:hypothetical protein
MELKKGVIIFKNKNSKLYPLLKEDEFIKSDLYAEVIDEQIGAYSNYYIKPQIIGQINFVLRVCFNEDKIIHMVLLSITEKGDIPDWKDWSEDENVKLKKMHDQWLLENIGQPPYIYKWGKITSVYSRHSGSSMIVINYLTPKR